MYTFLSSDLFVELDKSQSVNQLNRRVFLLTSNFRLRGARRGNFTSRTPKASGLKEEGTSGSLRTSEGPRLNINTATEADLRRLRSGRFLHGRRLRGPTPTGLS